MIFVVVPKIPSNDPEIGITNVVCVFNDECKERPLLKSQKNCEEHTCSVVRCKNERIGEDTVNTRIPISEFCKQHKRCAVCKKDVGIWIMKGDLRWGMECPKDIQ